MKHKLLIQLIVISLVASLALSACAPQPVAPAATAAPTQPPTTAVPTPQPTPITLVDGLGRTVTLSSPAQRIVSMAPSNTEVLFAVGAGSQVIGRDEFSDYPEEAKSLPTIGGSFGQYNLEEIAKLQPDLVLAAEINTPEQVQALENLGLAVYFLANPTEMEGVYRNLEIVGILTGHEEQAKILAGSLRQRVQAVEAKVAGATGQPTVFYELDSTDPNAPYTAGPGTFIDLLIQMAGGISAGSQLSGQWAQISAEQLIVFNPEIILLGDAAYGVTVESVGQRPGWDAISAVQNRQGVPV
jgi:iron complex transport system substrate-binding protein